MTYYPSVVTHGAQASGTRDAWAALLARLTVGFMRGVPADGSPAWSRLPGADPANRITGMEGFCRMSVAWSAWLGHPSNPITLDHDGRTVDVLDLVVRGLVDGTDPSGPWYWGDIRDRDQRIVEAAELAFTLWTGRDRILPALGPVRQRQVLAWMAQVHGRDVYADNWVLFPAIVATVSRGLGEPVDDRHIDEGIDRMLAWYRGDGWYSDGEGHAFDRYTGWAIHWHLLHWAEIDGDRRPEVRDLVVERARTWLRDLPAYAAEDGAIPFLGRSLGYRFATAGPLGLAAILDELPIDPGLARGIMDRSIRYHLAHDGIDAATDWFRVGVWGMRPDVCERYMSAGASAWAVRALVPLSLPVSNPFWATPDPGLPGGATRPLDPAVDLVLRGAGYLVGRRPHGGGTWVASGLMDHPDDIPGHDYRPSYGKWLFHSDFPYTNNAADGRPGPDGTMLLEGPRGGIGHRELVDDGGAGADWIWSRYPIVVDGASHDVSAVSIRVGDAWVRAIGLRPGGPVRAVTASLPLGVSDPSIDLPGCRCRRPGGGRHGRPTMGRHPSPHRLRPGHRLRAGSWRRGSQPGRGPLGAAVGGRVDPIGRASTSGAHRCRPIHGLRPHGGTGGHRVRGRRQRDARRPATQRRGLSAVGRHATTGADRAGRLDRHRPGAPRRAHRAAGRLVRG